MRKILEELYHGNLSVDERTIRAGSKYARALAEVAKIEEALYEKVPEKDHALLRDYALASAQLANVSMVEDFITGFRMGAQIMIRYNKLRKFQNRRIENSPQNKGQGQRHLVE